MRCFIELSYKGTRYNGWQRQNNAVAVQQVLEEAMEIVLRRTVTITGSSRTDTGVHAEQQFAHFDLETGHDLDLLTGRLNSLLPQDIAIHRIFSVPDDLNSRFVADFRRYQYRISRRKNPFTSDTSYLMTRELDVGRMNEAAALLMQYSDFECFSKVKTDVRTFLCAITEAEWVQEEHALIFNIQANRFLRGMVRAIVGTLLQVGTGKISVEDFRRIILSKDRKKAGAQAPAKGLTLTRVGYRNEKLTI